MKRAKTKILSNRQLGQQHRRAREARYRGYIDTVKDEIDEWDNQLTPAQAENALVELREYIDLALDSVPGRQLRAKRRAVRYMR